MIKLIDRKSVYEEITQELIRLIREGSWRSGDKIPGEQQLADGFGVSRNSVREALKALAIIGLIETRPGSGSYVVDDSVQNISRMELVNTIKETDSYSELMETRLMMEPQLAYLASLRATDQELEELEQLVRQDKLGVENDKYTLENGVRFHLKLMELSKNKVLSKFMHSITDELSAQRFLKVDKYFDGYTLERELDEHTEILNLLKQRKSNEVKYKVYDHIKRAL